MKYAYVFRPLAVATGLAAVFIAGCSGGNGPSYYNPSNGVVTPTPTPGVATPTPTAPAVAATELFIADPSGGIGVYDAQAGTQIVTPYGIPSTSGYFSTNVGVDNAGNAYEEEQNGAGGAYIFQEYSSTGTLVGTFTPSTTTQFYIGVSPSGEVVISGTTAAGAVVFDEWNADALNGSTAAVAPNQTIVNANANNPTFGLDSTGNLYISGYNGTNEQFYAYTAQSTTQVGTITDNSGVNQADYIPASMQIGPNGTLYVGEDALVAGNATDPDAGVFAYADPLNGTQTEGTYAPTTTGSVVSVDTDGSSNVYAAINNAVYNSGTGTYGDDSAAMINEYGSTLGTPTNSFADGQPGVVALTAASDGTVYLSQLGNGEFANGPATGTGGNVFYLAPGSTTAPTTALIGGTETLSMSLLYSAGGAHNGYNDPFARKKASYATVGGGHGTHGSFGAALRRARLHFFRGRAIVHHR